MESVKCLVHIFSSSRKWKWKGTITFPIHQCVVYNDKCAACIKWQISGMAVCNPKGGTWDPLVHRKIQNGKGDLIQSNGKRQTNRTIMDLLQNVKYFWHLVSEFSWNICGWLCFWASGTLVNFIGVVIGKVDCTNV